MAGCFLISTSPGDARSLGPLLAQDGAVSHSRYVDPAHVDLLAKTSRFLITEESASLVPVAPTSDHRAWRYYAELPQQPGQELMDGMRFQLPGSFATLAG